MTLRAALVVVLSACGATETPALATTGPAFGQLTVPAGLSGDAWLFLYRPGQGPPANASAPAYVTAVSAARLTTDAHFVFANVESDPFRLWGMLDVDGNFDPQLDVLAQPTLGDRVSAVTPTLNVQPGRGAQGDLAIEQLVPSNPPSFSLDGYPAGDVALDAPQGGATTLILDSDSVGRFNPGQTSIELGLVDANGDGRPDDANGDGIPDLSLQVLLHWLPRPGQLAAGDVVVPVVFDPSPFLGVLQGRLGISVKADHLQIVLSPTATLVTTDAHGQSQTTALTAPPAGEYELVLLTNGGQFWRLPNQLGPTVSSQAVRLHFDRQSP
jgi:hypothetical protein